MFGDSITAIAPDGTVSFKKGSSRRFDVIIGADGLHSNVRRLVFGLEAKYARHLGGYLSVFSLPNYLNLDHTMLTYVGIGRMAGIDSARHMDDARAVFLFRPTKPLDYHYRDQTRHKLLVREAFTGFASEVDTWIEHLDSTPAFYFDSITQLCMDRCTRGRIALIGDAGFCPGPAVGGSTSLAVVSAYVLAGELARAEGDLALGFTRYEQEIGDYVRASRQFAKRAARTIVPGGPLQLWALVNGVQLVSQLPTGLVRRMSRMGGRGLRLHDAYVLPEYSRPISGNGLD